MSKTPKQKPSSETGLQASRSDFKCTKCGKDTDRDDLMVKRVQFRDMGETGAIRKTRVTDRLCPDCLNLDPDWQRKPWKK